MPSVFYLDMYFCYSSKSKYKPKPKHFKYLYNQMALDPKSVAEKLD